MKNCRFEMGQSKFIAVELKAYIYSQNTAFAKRYAKFSAKRTIKFFNKDSD